MGDVSKNFNRADFVCRCIDCRALPNSPATKQSVIDGVQSLRDSMGKPLVVTRGVSCAKHNEAVGGATDSRHLAFHADGVDLAIDGPEEAYQIVDIAMKQRFFTTIRVYPHHVHLDARPSLFKFLASPADV